SSAGSAPSAASRTTSVAVPAEFPVDDICRHVRRSACRQLSSTREEAMARPISRQETECLMYVARNGPLAASNVFEGFGQPRGLARTSVLTVLERLRAKGHLGRRREQGVFVYRVLEAHAEVLHRSVGRF